METSRGIGVAVIVEQKDPAAHVSPEAHCGPPALVEPLALLRIDDVELKFDARPRNDNVTV